MTVVGWPVAADYHDVIQDPSSCFEDAELRACEVQTDRYGLPLARCGNFAAVYHVYDGPRKHAVRCFLREVPDQQQRYGAVAQDLLALQMPYAVNFQFIRQGIYVESSWYPILKMDWCDGELLHQYMERNLGQPQVLKRLADKWLEMIVALRRAGIAHGDLQHENIFVINDELKLIDYDGMYVPSLAGRRSCELGLEHYQHPGRNSEHFGRYLDNFSSWIIYTTLVAMSIDRSLGSFVDLGNKHLLFSKRDYINPGSSPVFAAMRDHQDETIRNLSNSVRNLLTYEVERVPELDPYANVGPCSGTTISGIRPAIEQNAAPGPGDSLSGQRIIRDRGNLHDTWSGANDRVSSSGIRDRGVVPSNGTGSSGRFSSVPSPVQTAATAGSKSGGNIALLAVGATIGLIVLGGGGFAIYNMMNSHPTQQHDITTHTVPEKDPVPVKKDENEDDSKPDKDANEAAAKEEAAKKTLIRADSFLASGDWPQALNNYTKIASDTSLSPPVMAHGYLGMGLLYASKSSKTANLAELTSALKYTNQAIQTNPKYAPAYYSRGKLFQTVGRFHQAEQNFEKAASIDSGDPLYKTAISQVQSLLKQHPLDNPLPIPSDSLALWAANDD